jgi:hypothetical protein
MDAHRFDDLIRSLSAGSSRRGVVVGLTRGLLTLLPLALTRGESEAKKKKKRKRKKRKKSTQSPPPSPPPPLAPTPCVPRCGSTKPCGPDGCRGSCGSCHPTEPHCVNGRCQCTSASTCPNPPAAAVCKAKACVNESCAIVNSPDGDPGTNCDGQQEVCQNGACVCVPKCGNGTLCGDDGCGGECTCADSAFCHEGACVPCDPPCPAGQRCLHGTCTCAQSNNTCPPDATPPPGNPDLLCSCGAVVADQFTAACVDGNSACDLDKPCDTHEDCPPRSVCLLGCSGTGNPRRCSTPCN